MRVHLISCDRKAGLVYFSAESRTASMKMAYMADLNSGEVVKLDERPMERLPGGSQRRQQQGGHCRRLHSVGDTILNVWDKKSGEKKLIYGVPLDQRQPGQEVPLNGIGSAAFDPDEKGLLLTCAIYSDDLLAGLPALQKTPGNWPGQGKAHPPQG